MRAKPTRRAWPPEMNAAGACHSGPKCSRSRNVSIQWVCSLSLARSLGMPKLTFSLTLKLGNSPGSWVRYPTGLLCKARDGGKNWRPPSLTQPPSGSSTPAMQASTVLLPAPEAPNNPNEQPCSNSSETFTLSWRRCFMTWALSMASALGQDMHEPGKWQGYGQEHHQQRHYSRQAKALQVDPELDRHS